MNKKQPNWQPIENLAVIARLIDGELDAAREHLKDIQEARLRPYCLDDATVNRSIRLYSEVKDDFLWVYEEQLEKWQKENLTPSQKKEITRLVIQTQHLRETVEAILTIDNELKEKTIEKLLAKDDAEVGLEYLLDLMNRKSN